MAVAFHPKYPNILVSVLFDETIIVWDLSKKEGKEKIRTLTEYQGVVFSVAFHPERPNILVSASRDKTVIVWDLSKEEGEEQIKTLKGQSYVYSVALSSKCDNNQEKEDLLERIDFIRDEENSKKIEIKQFSAKLGSLTKLEKITGSKLLLCGK